MVGQVAQRLDAAAGRARADGDQGGRLAAQADDFVDLLGRADRALHEKHVEWALRPARRGLRELDDIEAFSDRQQLILEVEQRQLAAVAGGELDYSDASAAARWECRWVPSQTLDPECRAELGEREDWSVLAHEQAAKLAVTAQPDAAVHVPFERHKDAFVGHVALVEDIDGRLHHALGAADECDRPIARAHHTVDDLGDHAHAAQPLGAGAIDRLCDLDDAARAEPVELVDEEPVDGRARAV